MASSFNISNAISADTVRDMIKQNASVANAAVPGSPREAGGASVEWGGGFDEAVPVEAYGGFAETQEAGGGYQAPQQQQGGGYWESAQGGATAEAQGSGVMPMAQAATAPQTAQVAQQAQAMRTPQAPQQAVPQQAASQPQQQVAAPMGPGDYLGGIGGSQDAWEPRAQQAQESMTDIDLGSLPVASRSILPMGEEDLAYARDVDAEVERNRVVRREQRAARQSASDARDGGRGKALRDIVTYRPEKDRTNKRREQPSYVDPYNRKSDTPYSERPSSNILNDSVVDSAMNALSKSIARQDVGSRVWAKLMPSSDLRWYEVGIGIGELEALVEQNPSYIDELLSGLFPDGAHNHDVHDIAVAVNVAADRHEGNEVRVGVSKPPDVNISDAQSMVLKIMSGRPRGIFINPMVAKLFNADFDGDDANVSMSKEFASIPRDTIDLLVDPDGTTHIDEDYFSTAKLVDDQETGMSRTQFVREVMFRDMPVSQGIVDAVLALGDNIDPKKKNSLMVRLMREIRDFVGSDNFQFEAILSSVHTTFQTLNRMIVADQAGQFVEMPVESRGDVDALTDDDRAILGFVDDVVSGKIPPNWLDFKRAFNSFIGDERRGNSDFRVSGSVGKRFKLDNHILIGNEYIIDLGDGRKVDTFLQATMEYAMAERMSHEFKRSGRSYSYTRDLRRKVVSAVGYPDSTTTLPDGRVVPRYQNVAHFLREFVRVYTRFSSITNEANLVARANMQISQASNRNVVASISPSGKRDEGMFYTYGDLVDAFVEMYGTSSMELLFKDMRWGERQPGVRDGWDEREWARLPGHKGFFANQRYKSFSVRQFAKGNNMVYSGAMATGIKDCAIPVWVDGMGWRVEEYGKLDKKSKKGKKGGNDEYGITTRYVRNVSDNIVEAYLMYAIADQKTSSESTYATRVYGWVDTGKREIRSTFGHDRSKQNAQQRKNEETNKYYSGKGSHKTLMQMRVELVRELKRARERGGHDKFLAMEDLIRVILASGPEMFSYFGMDSMAGWESSDLARAMEDAVSINETSGDRAINELGGINMTMHYRMRVDPITRAREAIKAYEDVPGMAEMESQTMNEIAFMEQELAASSETWQAIMMEMKTGIGWEELPKMARQLADPANAGSRAYLEAADYWLMPPERRHASVDALMRDARYGFVDKRNILCDLVRLHTGNSTFRSYEVCMQLEVGAGGEWSLKSEGKKQLFETYNNFERMFNQYGDVSYRNMVDNVEDAYERFGSERGALMGTIHRLATHPGMLCKVAFDTMADAVCAVMDRLYEQTEKSKSHPWSNIAYQVLSLQRNGGYFNEIYRTDDLVVGTQHLKQIKASDLVRVLDDPDFVLTGYNDIGQLIQVNRDDILGFERGATYDVEREVWRYLRDNPRIAGCLRMQTTAVSSTSDAKGYVVAACDTTETIARSYGKDGSVMPRVIDDVAYLMFDHPGFHAIASLCTPAAGSKSSHRSPKVAEVEEYMCYLMYRYSTDDASALDANAGKVLGALGITRKALRNAITSDYDREVSVFSSVATKLMAKAETDRTVAEMYDNCLSFVKSYLREVATDQSIDHTTKVHGVRKPTTLVDQSSVHSFYDVIQELSGAKTSVSTGIEGYETFQYGQWSQLIDSRDRYANLESILDDIENDPSLARSFDGALTNAIDQRSGHPMRVVTDGWEVTNLDELRAAAGDDDLVVLCPDTYEVRDRTIDSKGRTISSLRAYMMSKRAMGAENHNLQVMKTGIDGLDSISKVRSRYFLDTDGSIITHDKRVGMVREAASKASVTGDEVADREERLFLARRELARQLLASNQQVGYNDQTLSNYMSLADIMVIMGDDGEIYVRSLAQIYTALKHRIGVFGSEMSDEQRRIAVMTIVNDTSEDGCIGRAAGNAVEAFDALRPSRVSPSTRGISPYLSNQTINMRALEEIVSSTGHTPWDTGARERVERSVRKNHGWVNDVLKDAFILRQYHLVGCVDSPDVKVSQIRHDVGMSSLMVIGEGVFENGKADPRLLLTICNKCWEHGETIMLPASVVETVLHPMYAAEAMPCVTDESGDPTWYMVNTFNMRINGAEAKPYKATYAQAQSPYSKDMFYAEDTFGEFDYGDSGAIMTQHGYDKTSISKKAEPYEVTAQELFAQEYATLGEHDSIEVSFANPVEIRKALDGEMDVSIDLGVVKGANGYERRKADVERAIERYRQKIDDGDGKIIGQDCKAGDIVAWAMAKVTREGQAVEYVLAPIIPLPLHGRKRGMETFQCLEINNVGNDKIRFYATMVNTAAFDGYAKAYLPSGGADKVIVDLMRTIRGMARTLMDGTDIDIYADARTTITRRIGTLNRLRTMETMIRIARMNGYNFADAEGAFPEAATDPRVAQLKEALKRYPPPSKALWNSWVDNVRFHTDDVIDAFVRFNCRKCLRDGGNPSHFLASQFVSPESGFDTPVNSMFQWEYMASFENGLNYEDAFLRFFHLLNPSGKFDGEFCPNGIDDNSSDCLFRLKQDGDGNLAEGYDLGVLQMQVPHQYEDLDGNSRWVYIWECVFSGTGFFGEEFSAGSRPNIEGASRMSDVMNMIGNVNLNLSETDARLRYDWSIADLSGLPMNGSAITLWK